MLLVHKNISHMPITELENDSESIWVKAFANKTSHFVASWYRPPGSINEEFHLFREQLDYIRTHHKGKKLPSVHVLGDFNFKDIDWPDRLFILVGLGRSFFVCCLAHRGSTVGFLLLQCSSGVVDTPGISRCRSQHVSVESSSLLHHSIYLWFICFTWWFIDELENLHADRTTVCFEPW